METGDEVRWQFVIPSNLRKDVLHELHTMETAGHLGINKKGLKTGSIGLGAQKM